MGSSHPPNLFPEKDLRWHYIDDGERICINKPQILFTIDLKEVLNYIFISRKV